MNLLLSFFMLLFSTTIFAQKTEFVIRDTFIAGDDIYLITDKNVLLAGSKLYAPWATEYCSSLWLGVSSSPKAYVNPTYKYVNYPKKKNRKYCDYYEKLIKTIAYGAARGKPTVITVVEKIDGVAINLNIKGENYTFTNK